jgi:hypothetical protein
LTVRKNKTTTTTGGKSSQNEHERANPPRSKEIENADKGGNNNRFGSETGPVGLQAIFPTLPTEPHRKKFNSGEKKAIDNTNRIANTATKSREIEKSAIENRNNSEGGGFAAGNNLPKGRINVNKSDVNSTTSSSENWKESRKGTDSDSESIESTEQAGQKSRLGKYGSRERGGRRRNKGILGKNSTAATKENLREPISSEESTNLGHDKNTTNGIYI